MDLKYFSRREIFLESVD